VNCRLRKGGCRQNKKAGKQTDAAHG
jgi:hypothetical protein